MQTAQELYNEYKDIAWKTYDTWFHLRDHLVDEDALDNVALSYKKYAMLANLMGSIVMERNSR